MQSAFLVDQQKSVKPFVSCLCGKRSRICAAVESPSFYKYARTSVSGVERLVRNASAKDTAPKPLELVPSVPSEKLIATGLRISRSILVDVAIASAVAFATRRAI
jgi:hypothetical protein